MEEERLGRLGVTTRTPEETKYNFEYLLFLEESEDLGQAAREAIQRQSGLLARADWAGGQRSAMRTLFPLR